MRMFPYKEKANISITITINITSDRSVWNCTESETNKGIVGHDRSAGYPRECHLLAKLAAIDLAGKLSM